MAFKAGIEVGENLGQSFFRTERSLTDWRIAFTAGFAMFLWISQPDFLQPIRFDPAAAIERHFRHANHSYLLYATFMYALAAVMRWPVWLKILVLSPLLADVVIRLQRGILLEVDKTPFLTTSQQGLAWRVRWGQQSAAWADVTTIIRRSRLGLFGETEQLIVETRLLEEPTGVVARLFALERRMVPVTFVTPAAEERQVTAIISDIQLRAPDIPVREEEVDARPAWLRL